MEKFQNSAEQNQKYLNGEKMSKLKKSRGAGITLSYVNTFLNMICGLFLSAFLLRSLGDTDYGVYQTISSFANYLVLLEFGTGTVMTRNLSACRARNATKDEIEKNISTIWTITNVLSIVIIAVSVLFYSSLGSIYSSSLDAGQIEYAKQIFIVITVFLIVSFYLQTLNGITLAFEHYTFTSKTSIMKVVSRTLLLVVLVPIVKKALIIAVIDALVGVSLVIYAFIYCKRNFKIKINIKSFDKSILKASLPLCMAIFLQAIVNQANSNVAKFIIGIKLDPETVALYSVGLYVYNIFSSLTTIPISMYAPQITKRVVNGLKGKELTDYLIQPSRLIVLIGGTVFFGFFAVGKQFVQVVYGEKYLQAWLIAIIIMAPMFINMANGVIINVLDAMNKRMSRSIALLGTTAANIVLTLFWIDKFGIVGAACATAICTLVGQVIVMNIYYSKAIKIKVMYMYRKTFKGILPFQITGAAAAFAIGQYIENIYLSFLVSGVVYVAISLGTFVLIGKNETEKNMIKGILNKVKAIVKKSA